MNEGEKGKMFNCALTIGFCEGKGHSIKNVSGSIRI